MTSVTSDLRMVSACTAEEAAAVVTALALRGSQRAAEPDGYTRWRRQRIEAVRRTT